MNVERNTSAPAGTLRVTLKKRNVTVEGDTLVMRDFAIGWLCVWLGVFVAIMNGALLLAALGPNPPTRTFIIFATSFGAVLVASSFWLRTSRTEYRLRPGRLEKTFYLGAVRRSRAYELSKTPFRWWLEPTGPNPVFEMKLRDGKEKTMLLSRVGGLDANAMVALMNHVADRGVGWVSLVYPA